ncbi:MAG: hypothetical protein VB861_08740 [Planctomycetaceae bacterium]
MDVFLSRLACRLAFLLRSGDSSNQLGGEESEGGLGTGTCAAFGGW